jgi:hypothetical protein
VGHRRGEEVNEKPADLACKERRIGVNRSGDAAEIREDGPGRHRFALIDSLIHWSRRAVFFELILDLSPSTNGFFGSHFVSFDPQ